jgi:hypothetical protein
MRETEGRRMRSFGSAKHAHVEAAALSVVLTLLTYIVKWVSGIKFPDLVLAMPTFLAIFFGFYVILFVVFLFAWSRK